MPRLICVFAVRTYHFVCFVLLRLNCFVSLLAKIKIVISYVPCSPKLFCAPVPLIFRPHFPCSLEINAFFPVFLKTPAWAHHTSMTSWAKQNQLSASSCSEKSMHTDMFYFYLFIFFFFAIRSPNFSSFLFPFVLLFFSFVLCIFTARLFGSRSFGLGGVALSRQCCKVNFLKSNILRFFRILEASTVLPIHAGLLIFIPYIVCVAMYSNY